MQVEELYDLTSWIELQIVKNNIVQKYQQLQQIIHKNSQNSQPQQPFEVQREELVSALNSITTDTLSSGQIEILSNIGIEKNIGPKGAFLVEEILYKNVLDLASASAKLQEAIKEITDGLQWSQQIRLSLSSIINNELVTETDDKVLLRIHFTKDAHLSNLTEFKFWGKTWWEIGRGISMAHGESPESIQIVGASKGSIIVTLLSAYAIAKTTSVIILEALKVIEKVYSIRKNIQEIKALELQNDEAERALAKAANDEKENGLEIIVTRVIETIGLNPEADGDKVVQLKSSIKKLVDFIDKGGEVDFVIPNDEVDDINENSEQKQDLRVVFSEVRRLERKIEQLENKNVD